MRRAGFLLTSFLAASSIAAPAMAQLPPQNPGAQPPAPVVPGPLPGGQPQPQPPAQPQVDAVTLQHLQAWEKAMSEVKTFAVKAEMTARDRFKDRTVKHSAEIWCMAPNLTRLNLVKQGAPNTKPTEEDFTAFISNGKVAYHYDGAAKTLNVAKLGPNGTGNNVLLDIMSGMTATNALARFEVKTLKASDPKDPYIYLELKPRWKEDKSDFDSMQVILIPPSVTGRAYLPRLVKVIKPGGQQVEEWDFPDPKVNPKGIEEVHFQYVAPPKGWSIKGPDAPSTPNGTRPGVVAPPPKK